MMKSISERTAKCISVAIALLVWQAVAIFISNPLLLASPASVLTRLVTIWGEPDTVSALAASVGRITLGLVLACGCGILMGILASTYRWLEILLWPWVRLIRAVPVASFIILALLWIRGSELSLAISFLMVFPVVYGNVLEGMKGTDPQMLEMAQVFHLSNARKLRYMYLPQLETYLRAAIKNGCGIAWKAGAAAEVIAVAGGSVGEKLYESKIYFETADLAVWTVFIVCAAALTEQILLLLIKCFYDTLLNTNRRSVKHTSEMKQTFGTKQAAAVPLIVRDLDKSYEGRPVLTHCCMAAVAGEQIVLMGPSGFGKTTLLRVLAGLEEADAGSLEGNDVRIAYAFQEDRLAEGFSALANVRLATEDNVADETIRTCLQELGLQGREYEPVQNLSGGERRRVVLARTLLAPSQLLLMDEVFKGLDPENREAAVRTLERYRNGRTLLFVTHDPEEAAMIGGRIIRMEDCCDEKSDR